MTRKDYRKPTTKVVQLRHKPQLLSGSPQGDLGNKQTPTTTTWGDDD